MWIKLKKNSLQIALSLALGILFLGHLSSGTKIPLIETLDAFIYDTRLKLTMPKGVDSRIVILDVDEKSLAQEGQWPWQRDKLSKIIEALFAHYQISAAGFDVVFAEKDTSSGLQSLEKLADSTLKNNADFQTSWLGLRQKLDFDRHFAQAMQERSVVLGYYFNNDKNRQSGLLPAPALEPWMLEGEPPKNIQKWIGFGANIPLLQQSAASAGHFLPDTDKDGISRRVPMLVEYEGNYYESLSLAILRTFLGGAALAADFEDGVLTKLSVNHDDTVFKIPVDEKMSSLIPYRGFERSFAYYSLADVANHKIPKEALANKIVIIGSTAPGLMDLRATPVGASYPGVEIHANLIAGMLDGNIPHSPDYILTAAILQTLLCALLLAFWQPFLAPLKSTLLSLALLLLVITVNFFLWHKGILMPLSATMLTIMSIYTANMCWGYFIESKTKRQFTELFGHYVPPELVDEMAKNPKSYSMEGQSRELTVLFSDIRNFTSFSEGLTPKELSMLMNEYLSVMTQIIQKQRGTLDKYIGDAVMAFWGAPVADVKHAEHAVLAALSMQNALPELNDHFKSRGLPEFTIGIGINTGLMTVGDMGSNIRKSYTVLGDAVNLASRLEALTKIYGVPILIGEEVKAQIAPILCREIDIVRVKGKDKPVTIYEPLGLDETASEHARAQVLKWQDCLIAYRAQKWDLALKLLNQLKTQSSTNHIYALYEERINTYQQNAPAQNWDGVTTFTSK